MFNTPFYGRPTFVVYGNPEVHSDNLGFDREARARQRLVRAIQEQQEARNAYANLISHREYDNLGNQSQFATFNTPRRHAHRSPYGCHCSAAPAPAPQHEEFDLEHFIQLRLAARQQQLDEAARRQRELEAHREQQLQVARARQALQQQYLQQQEQRRAARRQQQQQSQEEAVQQAVALAVALAERFFGPQSETETEAVPAAKAPAVEAAKPASAGPSRRVRFAAPVAQPQPAAIPVRVAQTAAPASTQPQLPKYKPVAESVRIPIRESKGKSSSHVRVNSRESVPTSPADALATLSILESDFDGLRTSTFHSDAHRRHAFNQLLEQVDAVESGGEEAVRDVRRALVRRVENALEGRTEDEVSRKKEVGVKILDVASAPVSVPISIPVPVQVPVPAAPAPALVTVPTPVLDTTSAPAAESEGYNVPDYLEAVPLPEPTEEVKAVEPTAQQPATVEQSLTGTNRTSEDIRNEAFGLQATHVLVPIVTEPEDAETSSLAPSSATFSDASSDVEVTVEAVVPANTAPAAEDLADWESDKSSDAEEKFEVL